MCHRCSLRNRLVHHDFMFFSQPFLIHERRHESCYSFPGDSGPPPFGRLSPCENVRCRETIVVVVFRRS